jgi:hypothetical protein
VQDVTITNDERSIVHVQSFGFEPGGTLNFEVDDFVLLVPKNDVTEISKTSFDIAFAVLRTSTESGIKIDDNKPGSCFHKELQTLAGTDSPDTFVISLENRKDWNQVNFQKKLTIPGFYHVYFSNCETSTHVSFTLKMELYNVFDGVRNYLSAGETYLPIWYGVICLLFGLMLIIWLTYLYRNRTSVKSIHWLMTSVLVLKFFTLMFESLKYRALATTGHHNGWSVLFYIFNSVKGFMLFSVIALIGTGWSYLKPFLTERDKQLMLAVLVAQFMINIAIIVVDVSPISSSSWVTWKDILHLVDMACCCITLFPIVWSIRHLRDGAQVDGKAQNNLTKLSNFRTFYLLVIAYIYLTRIVVFVLSSSLGFEKTWVANVFFEACTMLFYGTTGYLFRPQEVNPYLALDQDESDARTQIALQAQEDGDEFLAP